LEITGNNLENLSNEAGGRRFQRVSPTEKRGRVHTSTITIAVIDPKIAANALFDKRDDTDFKIEWFQSLGSGGQNANRHHNNARITHLPTGIQQIVRGKSRESNLKQAKAAVIKKLDEMAQKETNCTIDHDRKSQLGSGQRGDKTRTFREQDDKVISSNGKRASLKEVMKGNFDLLW
jgi:peptide chain release factor 1